MKFNAMFQPINIGPMTVKNRFVVPPMGNNFANTDGSMSEQSAAYYRERAKGGFGLRNSGSAGTSYSKVMAVSVT